MLRKTLLRRQHVHPESGRYSQATFHDGAHRQAPGDSSPWRDTTNPLLKLRTWWMAPAAKGSIIAAWSCCIVVFSYCWSLQIDAKGTYTMNNVLLRNLHQEAVRADAAEERAKSMQLLLGEAQAAAKAAQAELAAGSPAQKKEGGKKFLGLFGGSSEKVKKEAAAVVAASSADGTPAPIPVPETLEPLPPTAVNDRAILDNNNSMINYELELTRERVRATQLHERNQNLVMEMNKIRSELYALRRDNKELTLHAERLERAVNSAQQ